MRSPGLFHLQPSSCWCSVYWSRRSWNTTRMMLWDSEEFSWKISRETVSEAIKAQWLTCSYLHHFTSDFWKFPNFPIVKHSNFIGLACNDKMIIQGRPVEATNLFLFDPAPYGLWIIMSHDYRKELFLPTGQVWSSKKVKEPTVIISKT